MAKYSTNPFRDGLVEVRLFADRHDIPIPRNCSADGCGRYGQWLGILDPGEKLGVLQGRLVVTPFDSGRFNNGKAFLFDAKRR